MLKMNLIIIMMQPNFISLVHYSNNLIIEQLVSIMQKTKTKHKTTKQNKQHKLSMFDKLGEIGLIFGKN